MTPVVSTNHHHQQQRHYSLPNFLKTDEGLPLNLIALPPLRTPNDGNDVTTTTTAEDDTSTAVDILAYGGEDGRIYLLPNYPNNIHNGNSKIHNKNNEGSSSNDNHVINKAPQEPILLRSYNDIPRCISISSDGLRLVIGFESGESTIFSFDDYCANIGNNGGKRNVVDKLGVRHHPFVNVNLVNKAIDKVNNNGNKDATKDNNDSNYSGNDEEDDDDEDDGFFTQSQTNPDNDDDDDDTTNGNIHEFNGPRFELSLRHLAFDPRSSFTTKQYYLAMGSESSDTPLRVVNVYDEWTVNNNNNGWFLEEEGRDTHGGVGVRSVAYSTTTTSNDNKDGTTHNMKQKLWLTTLGMDGKLNVWDVSSPLSLPENWEHVHTDFITVARPDAGSIPGAGSDAGDKACHLVWGTTTMKVMPSMGRSLTMTKEVELLLLPGKTDVQVRVIPGVIDSSETKEEDYYVKCFKKQQFVMDLERGHKDTIVAMAFEPLNNTSTATAAREDKSTSYSRKVVTAARDGKLLLWEMTCEGEEGGGGDKDTNSGGVVVIGGSLMKELSMVRGKAAAQGIPVITSIVWVGNVLYVAHDDGEISVVPVSNDAIVLMEEERGDEAVSGMEADLDDGDDLNVDDSIEAKEDFVETLSNVKAKGRVLEDDEDDDDDDLFQNDGAVAESARQQGKDGASKFIDDEAEAEEDDDAASLNAEKTAAGRNGDEDDDDDDKTQPIAEDNDDDVVFDSHNDPLEFDDARAATTNFSFPPLQPAFAPSSTPIGDSRRILCWNHMGVLTLRPDVEIDGNNLVDISFHDNAGLVGGRRPITFTDNVGFILGTLGDEGGLFASDLMEEEDDDDEFDEDGLTAGLSEATRKAVKRSRKKLNGHDSAKGSSVYFHRFDTFGKTSDKDWVYALPDGERVLGCATGSGWCGVMTR